MKPSDYSASGQHHTPYEEASNERPAGASQQQCGRRPPLIWCQHSVPTVGAVRDSARPDQCQHLVPQQTAAVRLVAAGRRARSMPARVRGGGATPSGNINSCTAPPSGSRARRRGWRRQGGVTYRRQYQRQPGGHRAAAARRDSDRRQHGPLARRARVRGVLAWNSTGDAGSDCQSSDSSCYSFYVILPDSGYERPFGRITEDRYDN